MSEQSFIEQQYTLRQCNRDYRSITGKKTVHAYAELDGSTQASKVSPLTTFDTTYGHCFEGKSLLFLPEIHLNLEEWVSSLDRSIKRSTCNGNVWDLDTLCTVDLSSVHPEAGTALWYVTRVMSLQAAQGNNPVSVYPAVAYTESRDKRGESSSVYPTPTQSTTMTGILGGISNNTTVEMGFDEPDGVGDMNKRSYDEKWIGFICCGHTAHSHDAGKSRRVSSYTRVRVLSPRIVKDCFLKTKLDEEKGNRWTVYCMGICLITGLGTVVSLVQCMKERLAEYGRSQFSYPNNKTDYVPPTFVIYYPERTLCISVSPGVIVRLMPKGEMIDSSMCYSQPSNPIAVPEPMPAAGTCSTMFKYSAFFLLCPYLRDDRPPRTLIASGQTVQAVCLPWAPATARVSPCHSSSPLVGTEFLRQIEEDQRNNDSAIWDVMPGTDMTVCFMNHPLNYDDSMIVNSRFADNGGFSTMSICSYRLSPREKVPAVGERLCAKAHKWWKMPCTDNCSCKFATLPPCRGLISAPMYCTKREPTAVVVEANITAGGDHQVKVRSYSQLLTGDKISTTHGQKGVVRLVPHHDMPVAVMRDGSQIIPDLCMAVSSITARQTVGQVFESGAAMHAVKTGTRSYIFDESMTDHETCDYLIDGTTGEPMTCILAEGVTRDVECTVGIIRVFNQTQLTRERHHLTHSSEEKHSLGTKPGRAAGGGVATSEMDFHAMFSSGMLGCAQELLNRGNVVRVMICLGCRRIEVLCECLVPGKLVPTRLSYDTVSFDILSACINGSANTYEVEHA